MTKEEIETATLYELVEEYVEQQNVGPCLEGNSGINNFMKMIAPLNYDSMDHFLTDNPGAIEAMLNWIKDQKLVEWKEAYKNEICPEEDDL